MSWSTEAGKFVNEPAVLIEVDFDSGTRKYSVDYIRPSDDTPYKGNVLRLPSIYNSIGDLSRTFESSRIDIIFDDTDYEFRTLVDDEGIKGRAARIQISFINLSLAANVLTVFAGQIFSGQPLTDLQYRITLEQVSTNFDNQYPSRKINLTDYASATDDAKGQLIQIPWGTVSADGLSSDGAVLALMVDDTQDAEIHLVGIQVDAITVPRVYINKTLKTLTTHYTIGTQVIDGFTHTEIRWVAAVRPTADDEVTCDVSYGTREPCEAFKYFLIEFCGYANGDFDAVSYAAAYAIGVVRGYTLNGLMREARTLRSWRDVICDEFELDIWVDPKDGLFHFKYLSSRESAVKHYKDNTTILDGYKFTTDYTRILNYIDYGWSYNYARDYFNDYDYLEDVTSQSKHGGTYREFKGLYFTRDETVAADIAARKLVRRKNPFILDKCPLPIESFEDDLADIYQITHFEGIGASGYAARSFQVRAQNIDLDKFVNVVTLEDAEFYMQSFCVLGDEDEMAADWLTADADDQVYLYVCDRTTGQFSNGDEGKRLFD